MTEGNKIADQLRELRTSLTALPEVSEPPKSILRILSSSRAEQKWNTLLAYFLDPSQPHGFGADLLKSFLDKVSQTTDRNIVYYHRDIETVRVDTEVTSPQNNVPDIVIRAPDEWFVCIESKVDASEGTRQTEWYVKDTYIGSEKKSDYGEDGDGHYYLFLSKENTPKSQSEGFEDMGWRHVVEAFNKQLRLSQGRYPARSVNQLEDFLYTITEVTNMEEGEFTKTQKEKVRLLAKYKQEIDELVAATNQLRERTIEEWSERFRSQVDEDLWTDEWRTRPTKWGTLYKDDWYLDGGLEPTEQVSETKGNEGIRLHFMHFIREEDSFLEGELRYELVCNTAVPVRDEFYRLYNSDRWQEKLEPKLEMYNIENRGNKSGYTRKTYDVDQSDLPESYIDTLTTAFEEHLPVAEVVDEILGEAVANVKDS